MGYLEGFKLKKMQGGLGKTTSTADSTFLLVCHLASSIVGLERNKLYRFIQIEDAEKIGINESFDANNNVLVHYHLTEVFRLAPNTELFFMVVGDGRLEDNDEAILTALRSKRTIKGIATFGFDNDLNTIATEVEVFQSRIIEEAKKDGVLVDFLLVEGKGKVGLTASDLEVLKVKNAPQVSVIIGQDTKIAAVNAVYKYHACIGSALGMISIRSVAENLGSVDIETKPNTAITPLTYPLTDAGKERFVTAGISTSEDINSLSSTSIKDIITKGYILVGPYVGVSGFYFSNSTTCVSSSSDYCFIENNRIWNKAARLVRSALSPRIKSKLKKDPSTGFLKASTTAYLENLAKNKAIDRMQKADEIAGGDVYINPEQSVTEDIPLKVKIRIVTEDILHGIEGEIGLTKNLE